MSFQLAQVNVARLADRIDGARLAEFVAALDPVNASAEAADGFVWRLKSDDGNATSIVAFESDSTPEDHGVIVNMSVWRDAEALSAFVFSGTHRDFMRRRREWFLPFAAAYAVCWWVRDGHRPSTDEAEERVSHRRRHGSTAYAFDLRRPHPPPALPG
ncbi:MAG: DUF3291 domain-containing protein [Nocardioides sp.]